MSHAGTGRSAVLAPGGTYGIDGPLLMYAKLAVSTRGGSTRPVKWELTAGADWQVERPVERVEPAVVRDAEINQIAVLLYCPIERHNITFHRIRVLPDRSVEFAESILVAHGPRGYLA